MRIPEFDVRSAGGVDGEVGAMETNGQHAVHPVVAEWMIPADYLRAFASEPGAVRIVRVAGDSMEPEYPAGERRPWTPPTPSPARRARVVGWLRPGAEAAGNHPRVEPAAGPDQQHQPGLSTV